jgi:hypothetical protein
MPVETIERDRISSTRSDSFERSRYQQAAVPLTTQKVEVIGYGEALVSYIASSAITAIGHFRYDPSLRKIPILERFLTPMPYKLQLVLAS